MSVVNVKVKFIRPRYANLKQWCEDPANVYIGRRGVVFCDGERYPKANSIWANPFKLKQYSRRESLRLYEEYIENKINTDPLYNLTQLDGKNLGCWCHPESCHGDILIEKMKIMTRFEGKEK